MSSVGGSDGDGGGTRYEKELAANKIRDAKYRESRKGEGVQASSGCFGSLLIKLVILSVVGSLVMGFGLLIFKLGSITFSNAMNTETISDFDMSQYAGNIIHMDSKAKCKVRSKALNCYEGSDEALKGTGKLVAKLGAGKMFVYRGYKREGKKTIMAVETISEKPSYCYVLLNEKWSGRSFWGIEPSKFVKDLTKKKKRKKRRKR